MSQRLPRPGGDNGDWGDILNSFLEVSHNSDGTLIPSAVTNAGAIPTSQIGVASGIAQLDTNSTLKASQLPGSVVSGSSLPGASGMIPYSVGSGSSAISWESTVQASQLPTQASQVTSYIKPSGDTTGTTDTSVIQTALNSGGIVDLAPGLYYIGQLSMVANSTWLRGSIPTRIATNGTGTGTVLQAKNSTATTGASFTATTNSTTTLSSVSSFSGLYIGMPVTGTGIPGGSYIQQLNSGASTLVISKAATASASGVTITPWGALLNTTNTEYCKVSGISFYSGSSVATSNAMQAINDLGNSTCASYLRIEDCYFNGFGGQNICLSGEVCYINKNRADNSNSHCYHIINTGASGASDHFITNNESGGGAGNGSSPGANGDALCLENSAVCTVMGNHFYNFANGIHVLSGNGHRIVGNRCEKHDSSGISLDQSPISLTGTASCVVESNSCFNNGYVTAGYGIRLYAGATNNLIVGNYCWNFASAPGGTNTTNGIQLSGSATRNRITGNYIYNVTAVGINFNNASYNSIDGNTIDTCGQQGILFTSATNNTIDTNRVYNASNSSNGTYDAVALTSSSNTNIITGLSVFCPGSAKVRYGLYIASGISGTYALASYCTSGNYGSGSISDSGTGTIIKDWYGYTVGSVAVSVPSSGAAVSSAAYDRTFYISAGSGTTSIVIGSGSSFTLNASALNVIQVPAGQSMTPTYSNAPTWVVYGNAD